MTVRGVGWTERTIGELCLPVDKIDPVDAGRTEIKYVDIGSVDGERQVLSEISVLSASEAPTRARQVLSSGDTVFSTVRPYLRKIAYIDDLLEGEFASTGFAVLRPGPEVLPRYLFYYATSPSLLDQVLPHQRGVSYPAVRDKDVLAARIPLPPVDEQRRIVEILEDHLSRLDAAESQLVAAAHRLDLMQASFLHGVLQECASVERLPMGELAVDARYGTSEKCVPHGSGAAVVRIPNLVNGRVDLTDEKRLRDASVDLSSVMLRAGDLLIVRTNGSRDLIGRTAVVQPGIDAAFASYLICYRLDLSRVRPEWIHHVLRAPSSRAQLESVAASSAGQYNLSLGKLNRVSVPVVPLDAQDSFIRRVAAVDEQVDRVRGGVELMRQRREILKAALLAAAFTGQLTGRAADEEVVQELAGV